MKQEVRNVGRFSASTPSSGSNYLLYSSVESVKTRTSTRNQISHFDGKPKITYLHIDHVVTMAWSMVKLVKSMTTALRIGDEEWTVY